MKQGTNTGGDAASGNQHLGSTEVIAALVARSGDLKAELVDFAQSPRFSRKLTALLRDVVDRDGYLDETVYIGVVDRFILQDLQPDGRTLVEHFVDKRRPPLSEAEAEMLLGWRDVVEGVFEITEIDHDAVSLHNLADDRVYRAHSNMGAAAFAQLRRDMFLIARLVPEHPALETWLISGSLAVYPGSQGPQLATEVLEMLAANPRLMSRNPSLTHRAWQMQTEERADFIAVFGSDLAVLAPAEAQRLLAEHYRRRIDKAVTGADQQLGDYTGPTAQDMSRLPEDMLAAETIAIVYDEIEGLNYYRDFARLDDLFADPALARDRTYLGHLREYMNDDTVSPLAIRRLVQRHPDGADQVFRALLRKPAFRWERDGEQLLRQRKKAFFGREPTPSIAVVGDRLAELVRAAK